MDWPYGEHVCQCVALGAGLGFCSTKHPGGSRVMMARFGREKRVNLSLRLTNRGSEDRRVKWIQADISCSSSLLAHACSSNQRRLISHHLNRKSELVGLSDQRHTPLPEPSPRGAIEPLSTSTPLHKEPERAKMNTLQRMSDW